MFICITNVEIYHEVYYFEILVLRRWQIFHFRVPYLKSKHRTIIRLLMYLSVTIDISGQKTGFNIVACITVERSTLYVISFSLSLSTSGIWPGILSHVEHMFAVILIFFSLLKKLWKVHTYWLLVWYLDANLITRTDGNTKCIVSSLTKIIAKNRYMPFTIGIINP